MRWHAQLLIQFQHVHPRKLDDCQFYVKYLFEEANTKTINSLSLRKAFYIHMTLPFFFFVCFSFYIYFLKIFESWVLFTFIFTSYIWLLSSERAPKISFSKMVTDIEASEISRFREPLHVSNVSAFREKWRKWQSVRNALRIPGFIVQINKLIVPLNKNVYCRAFTTLDNYACLWILNMQSRHLVPLAPLSIGAGKAVHIQ